MQRVSNMRAIVHCRTGSLETADQPVALIAGQVHCRTGSLESQQASQLLNHKLVHCRTGSLEMPDTVRSRAVARSLPYRQLRKARTAGECSIQVWFTAVQAALKMACSHYSYCFPSSLPYRQLRNERDPAIRQFSCSLPYRQLRNITESVLVAE